MKFFFKFFISIFVICATLPAYCSIKYFTDKSSQIFSTNNLDFIKELIEETDKDTLVLWDVDQTLITPVDPVLKPKWESYLDQLMGGKKVMIDNVGKKRYIFREILIKAPHSVVDRKSIAIIQTLKDKEVPVIAFTAAPGGNIGEVESFIDWRIDELQQFGFDFSSTFSDIDTLSLPKDPDKEFAPVYKSGVLVTSLHDKGPVLTNFFKEINWTPKKVIFIDDKMANIDSVVQSLGKKSQVIGVHYTAANEIPCNLDVKSAKCQINHFLNTGKWISQSSATKVTNQNEPSQK